MKFCLFTLTFGLLFLLVLPLTLASDCFFGNSAEYLIITNEELANSSDPYNFTTLCESKMNRNHRENLTVKIVTVESIYNNASFYCDGPWGDGCVEPINESLLISIPLKYVLTEEDVLAGTNSFNYTKEYDGKNITFFKINISSPFNNSWFNQTTFPINLTWENYNSEWLVQNVSFEYSFNNSTFFSFTPNSTINFSSILNSSSIEQDFNLSLRFNYSMRNNGSLFNDSAAWIRNYLKYAHQNLSTKWVLLGGDSNIIPARKIYAHMEYFEFHDQNVASDNYYSNLEGSFNYNLNSLWGDDVVFLSGYKYLSEKDDSPELYLGRMSVENSIELSNIIRKTLMYEEIIINNSINSSYDESKYLKNYWYIRDPSIYFSFNPSRFFEKSFFKMFIRDWALSSANYSFIDSLNSALLPGKSPHIINYAGHGSYFQTMGGFTNTSFASNVANLTNKYPFFLTSVACLSADFNRDVDSVYEQLMYAENGSFALFGNVGNGWYGVIYEFDWAFDEMFKNSSLSVGEAYAKGMPRGLSFAHLMYWGATYFGDPEIHLFLNASSIQSYMLNISSPKEGSYYASDQVLFDFNFQEGESIILLNESEPILLESPTNIAFSEGRHYVSLQGNNSAGESDDLNVSFIVDLTPPKIDFVNISENKTRYSLIQINLTVDENTRCMQNITLETNASGQVLNNYTYSFSDNTSVDFSATENISTSSKNFSYRFYLLDCAGHENLTEWVTIDVENSPPIFVGESLNRSVFFLEIDSINLSSQFSDLDLDSINFSIISSENITSILNGSLLNVGAQDSNIRNGYINLNISDGTNSTNVTFFFDFYTPIIDSGRRNGFDGNTTNLSNLNNYTNISLILEKSSFGKIEFDSINLTVPELSLSVVNISVNSVSVNTSYAPGLNSPAKVSLVLGSDLKSYCTDSEWHLGGRDYTPVVYKVGEGSSEAVVCNDCVVLSCSDGNLSFRVNGFSTYIIKAASCFDGIKNQIETGVDCGGSCSPCSSSSGNGGGGGGKPSVNKSFNLSENTLFNPNLTVNEPLLTNTNVSNSSDEYSVLTRDIDSRYFWLALIVLSIILIKFYLCARNSKK
jgi:hypothetical protein